MASVVEFIHNMASPVMRDQDWEIQVIHFTTRPNLPYLVSLVKYHDISHTMLTTLHDVYAQDKGTALEIADKMQEHATQLLSQGSYY